jgi:hypothetical protein
MGNTRKPRKAYRRRPLNNLATLMAMQGACLLSVEDRMGWQDLLHDALTAVRTGVADRAQWASLFDAINLVEELCRMGLAKDTADVVPTAQAAVCAILDRLQATGVRSARAAELQALRDLVSAFADLMAGITHKERFDAEARVAERVRRVLSQKPAAGADVRIFDAEKLPLKGGKRNKQSEHTPCDCPAN